MGERHECIVVESLRAKSYDGASAKGYGVRIGTAWCSRMRLGFGYKIWI